MARAPRTRKTKHRGNAAGMIESRGRTGRRPSAAEKGPSGGGAKRSGSTRKNRYESPPTWKGSLWRAAIAAAVVYAVSTLILKHTSPTRNLILVPIVLALYMPVIYYTDHFMYRRAQKRNAAR
jgi:hypothetical protein